MEHAKKMKAKNNIESFKKKTQKGGFKKEKKTEK